MTRKWWGLAAALCVVVASVQDGQNALYGGGDEHPLSPKSHILLGVQIALGMLLILGFGACLLGFQRGGDAVYRVLHGDKVDWWCAGGWCFDCLSGAVVCALVITYWIEVFRRV